MKVKEIAMTALFAAIMCVLSVITVPIGAVPITLSVFGVFLISSLLKPKCAISAILVYIILGAIGLPVFSGFKAGIGVLFGPTGGYIVAYPFMAAIISVAAAHFKKYKAAALVVSMILALVVCYLLGTAWYSISADVSFVGAFSACVTPFIPFDTAKMVGALVICAAAGKAGLTKLINQVK